MQPSELVSLPNLFSLARIFLIPFFWYFLAGQAPESSLIAAAILIVAGITDWLDGFLARRMGKITPLGIALDPVADKIFAGCAVILLILYRDFPLWLAVAIIGRDLLILVVGSLLLRGKQISLPANLTGKYAFASIALLIGSVTIRFSFGINLFTWISAILIVASLVNYSRVALAIKQGIPPPVYKDTFEQRAIRIGLTILCAAVLAYELYLFIADGGLGYRIVS